MLGETVCRVEYVRSAASVVLDALLGNGRLRASDSGYEFPEKDVVRLWSWVLLGNIPGEVEFAENNIINNFLRSEFPGDVLERTASLETWCCGLLHKLEELGLIKLCSPDVHDSMALKLR